MQVWRKTIVPGDPLKGFVALWSRGGLLPATDVTLVSGTTQVPLVPFRLRPSVWMDESVMCCYRVPSGVPFGVYQLRVSGVPTAPIWVVEASSPRAPSVVTDRVTDVRQYRPDTLFWRAVFDRTPVFSTGGLYVDCDFVGLSDPGTGGTHSFSTWGLREPLALVGCNFRGTGRGPVFDLVDGSIVEPLMLGLTLTEVSHIDGGNELFVVEKRSDAPLEAELVRPMLVNWKCYNNEGDLYFAAPTRDVLIRGMVMDRGSIVGKGAAFVGGVIEQCELRNGRIVPGDCSGLTVDRCALLDMRPTRGNRTYTERFFYEPTRMTEDECKKAATYNLPAGITSNGDFTGLTVRDCVFGAGATYR